MNRRSLERSVAKALDAVELDSRSANKFAGVARVFGHHLCIDPSSVGVKTLAEPKNYGNRISESTGQNIEVLVLIAADAVDRETLRRSLEARALRPVPAVLLCLSEGSWVFECQYVPAYQTAPITNLDTVSLSPAVQYDGRAEFSVDISSRIDSEILKLREEATEEHLEHRLAALAQAFPTVSVKHASEPKNFRNRLREALGRRPSHLLLVVSAHSVEAAEKIVRIEGGWANVGSLYVVWHEDDRVGVRKVKPMTLGPDKRVHFVREQSTDAAITESSMTEELDYRQLERVKQMHRFLPFDASADNLFEEHLAGDQRLQYETRTLAYLRKLVANRERCVIVLTGNAGHGKTHMCRRLLEHGDATDDVMSTLHQDPEGRRSWEVPDASLPIRIVKDLSELNPPGAAAGILTKLVQQRDAHVVVCANEGRLRDVVSRSTDVLNPFLSALDRGLERGETNPEENDSVHVINLNFQAAVAADGGFLRHVLTHFLDSQASWNVCTKCRAQTECPIFANRNELTLSRSADVDNRNARDALMDLVRVAEESGYVLTYREALMLVAFLITGGLGCREIEHLHRDGRRRPSLQDSRLLNLLFEPPLTEDQADIIRVLQTIKRLDPGKIALRPVDEELHRELEQQDRLGAGVFGQDSVQPRSKRDLQKEVDDYRGLIRRARRRAWLTSSAADEERLAVTRSQRLGLGHHKLFRSLQEGPGPTEVLAILRRVVKGLHTIQGAVNVDSKTSLHLVDPAFGRSGNHSAIIARSIRIKDLELWPESRWWQHRRMDSKPPMLEAVEWIDRRILLVDRVEKRVLLFLDLAAFEFVMSAANGIVMREFNAADRRRVLTRLAHHAERGAHEGADEIRVLLERGDGTLTVERDGTILLERS